jgi:hypothetical protein
MCQAVRKAGQIISVKVTELEAIGAEYRKNLLSNTNLYYEIVDASGIKRVRINSSYIKN